MAWTLTEFFELLGKPLRGFPQPPRFLLLSYAIAVSNSCAVVGGRGRVSWRIDSALK